MSNTKHVWEDSRDFFVGSLYPRIYPWYCKCGAFYHSDGTIKEPWHHCKIKKCSAGKFCATTQGRPDHMTPAECPLLRKLGLEYLKEESQQ